MGSNEKEDTTEFLKEIQEHFKPQPGLTGDFKIVIEEKKTPLFISINGGDLQCFYGEGSRADVGMQMTRDVLSDIIAGKTTFQASFMAGDMKMKGDFKALRVLDQALVFGRGPVGV